MTERGTANPFLFFYLGALPAFAQEEDTPMVYGREMHLRRFVLIFACLLLAACRTFAQTSTPPVPTDVGTKPLRIQTRIVPPFVQKDADGKLTGFSVELWDAVAREANLPSYTFAVSPNVSDLLQRIETNRADIGVAAVSITAERDARFDFSQPFYNSGLQILVRDSGDVGGTGSTDDAGGSLSPSVIVHNLLSPAVGKLFLWLMLLAVIVAHIIWLLERNHPDSLLETKKYFPGIFKATWWAAATLGAQADEMPKTYSARIVAVLLMFVSALSVAYFTAAVTAQITVQRLAGAISGPDDLPGKRVATTAGSTAARYLDANQAKTVSFDTIEQACDALQAGKADAVVYDAPVLLYYAAHEGKKKTRIVGPVFRKEDYGIVFRQNAALRKRVNVALLKIKENGEYDAISTRWFGDANGTGQQ